jgi:anti-anti-sigma factor
MAVSTTVSSDGTVVTVRVSGRFDFTMHKDFLRAYKEHPPGENHFVVDLGGADYLDSSGMGMLLQLRAHAAKDRPLELVNGSEDVREILQIANFDRLFKVA